MSLTAQDIHALVRHLTPIIENVVERKLAEGMALWRHNHDEGLKEMARRALNEVLAEHKVVVKIQR